MANLWGRLKSYVTELEKSIDADFAQRSAKLQPEKEPEVAEVVKSDSESDDPPADEPPSETTDETKRMEDLRAKILEIEENLEKKNLQFEKLQKVSDDIGPAGISLVNEFDTRSSKIKSQLNSLSISEKTLNQEIGRMTVRDDSFLEANGNLHVSQQNIAQLQDMLHALSIEMKTITEEASQLDISKAQNEKEISQIQQQIENIETDSSDIHRKTGLMERSIQQLEQQLIHLSSQCSQVERELEDAEQQRSEFIDKREKLQAQLIDAKRQLDDADAANAKAVEERRRRHAGSMMSLASSIMKKKNDEKQELSQQRAQLAIEIEAKQQKYNDELRDINIMIQEAENDTDVLRQREVSVQDSIRKSAEDIGRQADAMKTRYQTNDAVAKMASDRLLKLVSEVEARRDTLNAEIAELETQRDSIEKRRLTVKREFEDLMDTQKSIQSDINKLNEEIERKRVLNHEKEAELEKARSEEASLEAQLRQITARIKNASIAHSREANQLERILEELREKEASASHPSLFVRWKNLAKECSDLEIEYDAKKDMLEKHRTLQIVFDQTLQLVAERQEEVDVLKRTINREKEFFKKKVAEML